MQVRWGGPLPPAGKVDVPSPLAQADVSLQPPNVRVYNLASWLGFWYSSSQVQTCHNKERIQLYKTLRTWLHSLWSLATAQGLDFNLPGKPWFMPSCLALDINLPESAEASPVGNQSVRAFQNRVLLLVRNRGWKCRPASPVRRHKLKHPSPQVWMNHE